VGSTFHLEDTDTATTDENCYIFIVSPDGVGVPSCTYELRYSIKNLDYAESAQINRSFDLTGLDDGTFSREYIENLAKGFYTGEWTITFGNKIIAATTTRFIVVSTVLSSSTVDQYTNGTTTAVSSQSDCSGLGFLTFSCWRYMFLPDTNKIKTSIDDVVNTV
jgi:hypothetical protein